MALGLLDFVSPAPVSRLGRAGAWGGARISIPLVWRAAARRAWCRASSLWRCSRPFLGGSPSLFLLPFFFHPAAFLPSLFSPSVRRLRVRPSPAPPCVGWGAQAVGAAPYPRPPPSSPPAHRGAPPPASSPRPASIATFFPAAYSLPPSFLARVPSPPRPYFVDFISADTFPLSFFSSPPAHTLPHLISYPARHQVPPFPHILNLYYLRCPSPAPRARPSTRCDTPPRSQYPAPHPKIFSHQIPGPAGGFVCLWRRRGGPGLR